MSSSKLNEIIRRVDRYVRGKEDRARYRAWLVDEVWAAEDLGSASLEDILYELESLDAEFTSGHWSEDELKSELRDRILASRLKEASA